MKLAMSATRKYRGPRWRALCRGKRHVTLAILSNRKSICASSLVHFITQINPVLEDIPWCASS